MINTKSSSIYNVNRHMYMPTKSLAMADNTSTCYNNFTTTERAMIGLAGAVTATLSVAVCLFAILINIVYKKYVITYQMLVLFLTICVLADNIAHITQGVSYEAAVKHNRYCQALGFFNEYLPLCIVVALACIVLELYLYVLQKDTNRLKWRYATVIFLLPASVSWIPFAFGKYGLTGTFCFITYYNEDCEHSYTGLILLATLWWLPYIATIVVMGPMYFALLYRILQQQKRSYLAIMEPNKSTICPEMAREFSYLKWLPLFVFCTCILPIVSAVIGYSVGQSYVSISTISAIFLGLKGGVLVLLVTLDPNTCKVLNWNSFNAAWHQNILRRSAIKVYPVARVEINESILPN